MLIKDSAFIGLLILALPACRTLQTGQQSNVKNAEHVFFKDMKKFTCDKGEPAFFLFSPVDGIKESDFTPLPMVDKWGGFDEYTKSAQTREVRLEICLIDDKPIAKKLVEKLDDTHFIVIDIPQGTPMDGLEEVIFNEDYSKLNIQFPVMHSVSRNEKKASVDIIVLEGSKTQKAAIVYSKIPKKNSFMVGSDRGSNLARIGKLEYQEPSNADLSHLPPECNLKPSDPPRNYRADARYPHALKTGVIEEENVKIDWVGFVPTGITTAGVGPEKTALWALSYMCKATITDKSKALGGNAGVPISFIVPFQGPERQAAEQVVVKYYQTHHFDNDGLRIRSPFAVYGFGKPNENDPFLPSDGTNYKVTYITQNLSK